MFPLGFQAALNLGDTGFLGHANCSVERENSKHRSEICTHSLSFFFAKECLFSAPGSIFFIFLPILG